MQIVKTLLLLLAFFVGNYFITIEMFDIESLSILKTLICVFVTSLGSMVVFVLFLAMFALFYNILGGDK